MKQAQERVRTILSFALKYELAPVRERERESRAIFTTKGICIFSSLVLLFTYRSESLNYFHSFLSRCNNAFTCHKATCDTLPQSFVSVHFNVPGEVDELLFLIKKRNERQDTKKEEKAEKQSLVPFFFLLLSLPNLSRGIYVSILLAVMSTPTEYEPIGDETRQLPVQPACRCKMPLSKQVIVFLKLTRIICSNGL